MKKIGLLFGSFNPLHNGHIMLAEMAQVNCQLDDVWFVLQASNSYKPSINFMDYETRKLLIEEAGLTVYAPKTTDYAHFILETLRELPGYDLTLILGNDLQASFEDWQDAEAIKKLAHVYAAPKRLDGISSGLVRDRLTAGEPIDHLVPHSVSRYLAQ